MNWKTNLIWFQLFRILIILLHYHKKSIMTKPILVSGGCGFVGRHLTNRLLKNGSEVTIVDDLSTGINPERWVSSQFSNKYTFYNMDFRDFLKKYGNEKKFSDVYHLAAIVGGRIKIEKDPIAVALDLSLDAEFFNWVTKSKPERVLYASSSAAYPINLQQEKKHVELNEENISFDGNLGTPDMTYGWAKLTGEYLSRLTSKYYDINIACIRPFSGYGEDQDESYPIPAITQRAVNHENPLVIWGDGKQGRDFVHIDDCIDAMLLAIEKISDGSGINISSGTLTTFLEIAQMLAEIAQYDPDIKSLVNMPQGVFARYGSNTLAKRILNWSPKVQLKDGLKLVYDHLYNKRSISQALNSV